MKKTILAFTLSIAAMLSLAACSGFSDSPEQKQFKAFVATCKAAPATAGCAELNKQGDN